MWRPKKWQRNAIFEAVVAGGLNAGDCVFASDDEASWRITHLPSKSYVVIQNEPGHYTVELTVADGSGWPFVSINWSEVAEQVRKWATAVQADADVPDLWEQIQRERQVLVGASDVNLENTPFTPDEQAEIAEQMRQIKELIASTYSLSEVQMLSLESKLDEMAAAASRVGRKDWQLLFRGVMLTLIVEAVLPADAVRHAFVVALHALDHLFGGGSGTPELPGELPRMTY